MSGPLPLWVVPAIISVTFAVLFVAETVIPLRPRVEPRFRHLVRNFTTGGISLAIMTLVQTPLLIPVSEFIERNDAGLLHWLDVPRPYATIVAIILLDYTLWIWHWASHRVPFLWRFHLPHHVDLDLDASTALRFHFGELVLSIGFRALQIVVIGADPLAVAIWQAILFVAILFHHSNVRLPRAFESLLVRLIVTPRMHGIHHSARPDETHSNWSSILTVWDMLHRTFRFDVPDQKIIIGIPAYQRREEVTIGKILTLPFRRQKDDWAGSAATGVSRS